MAQQSYDRFPTAVFIANPDLVIWQAGTNEVGNVELSTFIQILQSGSYTLLNRGYEIMFLEPQYYQGVGESQQYISYVLAMQSVATQLHVEIIPRYALIKNQVLSGNMDVLSTDHFHLSDKGYGIVADYIFNILNK